MYTYNLKNIIKTTKYFSTNCLEVILYILNKVEKENLIKPDTKILINPGSSQFVSTLHNSIRYVVLDNKVLIEFEMFDFKKKETILRENEGYFCIYMLLEIITTVAEDCRININIQAIRINGRVVSTEYLKKKEINNELVWALFYNRIELIYSEHSIDPIEEEFDTLFDNINTYTLLRGNYE